MVATADELTLGHAQTLVNDMIIVSEELIEDSIVLLLQIEKYVCEGANAAGLAAVLADRERSRGNASVSYCPAAISIHAS